MYGQVVGGKHDNIYGSIIYEWKNVSLFTFTPKFCLRFFLILKAPKINYSDRKVIVGVQKSLWKTHNY